MCVLTEYDAAGGVAALTLTQAKAQTQRALHWLTNEDPAEAHRRAEQAEAHDAAEHDTAEGNWALTVDTGESDMDKAEMPQRIQRLESTNQHLSDRESNLEAELPQVIDRLELLPTVMMDGTKSEASSVLHGGELLRSLPK